MGSLSDASRFLAVAIAALVAFVVAAAVVFEDPVDVVGVAIFACGVLAVVGLFWRYRAEY